MKGADMTSTTTLTSPLHFVREHIAMNTIKQALHSLKRVGQTTAVIAKNGGNWLVGNRVPAPQWLRETFEQLGCTYVKLGQFIASSPTLFPESYVEEFQKCLDQTHPIPFDDVLKVLEKEFPGKVGQLFRTINPKALASASIAQVHEATLFNGDSVVIKVQKPGTDHILKTDLGMIHAVATVIERLVPHLSMASVADIIEEIKNGMCDETDFEKEAHNIEVFLAFIENQGIEGVTAPKVYASASSKRVLTMEKLNGTSFTNIEAIQHVTDQPEDILIVAMNTWFKSVMGCESFHADVHAGNVLVLEDGRVGFIDFGIVGRIKPETWGSVFEFVQAITTEDYQLMAKAMLGIGLTHVDIDVNTLAGDIQKLYARVATLTPADYTAADAQEGEVNKLLLDLVQLAKQHGIHFPREFALLLKQMLYFDRYVRLLAGDINFYQDERLQFTQWMSKG